jgi:hypothetical protein
VEREKLKKEREKEKEKKAQELAQRNQQREEDREAVRLQKAAKQSRISPKTTLKNAAPKRKRVGECTGGASDGHGGESSQAPPPKTTRTGRSITIPKKFR